MSRDMPCSNSRCRLGYAHSGPCDTRTDTEVALALGPEWNAARDALARATAWARKMNRPRASAAELARDMAWWLRDAGWQLVSEQAASRSADATPDDTRRG